MTASTPTTNVKKIMTAAQIAFYTGKRIDTVKWALPEGYGICTITHKMLPESELMVTFAHHHFTDDQLAQLGHWGEGWCECAEWLSEDGYHQIMARVEACGLKDVYEAGDWGPAPVVATAEGTESAPVIAESAPVETPVIDETPAAPKNGDTVAFIKADGSTDEGVILYVSWMATTKETTYYIKAGNRTYAVKAGDILLGKMPAPIMDLDTAPAAETQDDILDTLRAINAASLAWQEAYLANPGSERTARLSQAHDALYEAYMTSIGARVAPQTGKEGVSSPSTASQVTSIEMDAQPAEIASTRDCEASGLTRDLDRHQQKERRWASDAAQQFGIDQSSAPRPPVMTIVKPTRAMNAAEQANHDALQAMIRAAGGAS